MSLLGSPGPPPPSPPPPRWLPTHVQVTVLRARGLRGKGTGGSSTSDAYAVIQLGPDRYRTSVVEKTAGCPEWREECTFQLPPAALPRPDPDPGGPPPPDGSPPDPHLLLTAMHRSLIGLDKFLGRAVVPLDPLLRAGRDPHTQWYKLHSKVGKREKERGEIQVTIQLTRTSLSASMFDLSAPDKPRSPFGKLKDKVKGHRKFELESASAIIPGSVGRLEDAEGLELDGKKGKAKGFFFRNKLRKSSLTRSSTSLGSDSTISSASGSLAPGFGTLELEGAGSPGRNNSLSGREAVSLPKTLTHKRAFSDEASQVTVALPRAVHDLKAKNDPVSRSSLCVNGSHVYNEEPRPAAHRPFPLSGSLQNLAPRGAQDGPGPRPASAKAEGPPWGGAGGFGAGLADAAASPRPAGPGGRAREEEGGGGEGERRAEGKPVQIATPLVFGEREDARREEKKTRPGLFLHHHHGGVRSEPGPRGPGDKPSPQNPAGADDRGKGGWFGSRDAKEPGQKPSVSASPPATPPEASADVPPSPGPPAPESPPPQRDAAFDLFAAHRPGAGADAAGQEEADSGTARGVHADSESAGAKPCPGPPSSPGPGGSQGDMPAGEPSGPVSPEPPGSGGPSALSVRLRTGAPLPAPSTSALETGGEEAPVEAGGTPAELPESCFFETLNAGAAPRPPCNVAAFSRFVEVAETPSPDPGRAQRPGADPEAPGVESVLLDTTLPSQVPESPPSPAAAEKAPGPVPLASLSGRCLQVPAEAEGREAAHPEPTVGPPPPKPPRLFSAAESCPEEEEEEEEKEEEEEQQRNHRQQEGAELTSVNLEDVFPGAVEGRSGQEGTEAREGQEPRAGRTPRDHLAPAGTGEPATELEPAGRARVVPAPGPESPVGRAEAGPESPGGRTPPSEVLFWTAPEEFNPGGSDEITGSPKPEDRRPGEPREALGGQNPFVTLRCPVPPSPRNPFLAELDSPGEGAPPRVRAISPLPSQTSPPPLPSSPSPSPPLAEPEEPGDDLLSLHATWPLAFSTPFPETTDPDPFGFPSPVEGPPEAPSEAPLLQAGGAGGPRLTLLPQETRRAERSSLQPVSSPHPVKPISATPSDGGGEKKQHRSSLTTALSSGLERLKTVTSGGVQPVAPAPQQDKESKKLKDPSPSLDGSARYYHLTHDELIKLLLQRERELSQRDEHVRELESYIDRLLVRIMEQSPSLLQITLDQPGAFP